jgi:hypothetical protein
MTHQTSACAGFLAFNTHPQLAPALPVTTTAVVAPLLDDASLSLPASAAAMAAAAAASGTVTVLLPRRLLLELSTAMQGQAILGENMVLSLKKRAHPLTPEQVSR